MTQQDFRESIICGVCLSRNSIPLPLYRRTILFFKIAVLNVLLSPKLTNQAVTGQTMNSRSFQIPLNAGSRILNPLQSNIPKAISSSPDSCFSRSSKLFMVDKQMATDLKMQHESHRDKRMEVYDASYVCNKSAGRISSLPDSPHWRF